MYILALTYINMWTPNTCSAWAHETIMSINGVQRPAVCRCKFLVCCCVRKCLAMSGSVCSVLQCIEVSCSALQPSYHIKLLTQNPNAGGAGNLGVQLL